MVRLICNPIEVALELGDRIGVHFAKIVERFGAATHPIVRRRTNDAAAKVDNQPSLRDWAAADFETWQDRLSGAQAALHVLLPVAAAAVRMTAFGIAFRIAEHGAI